MKIDRDSVVRIHYELSDQGGQPLQSSRDGDGFALLIGHGNVIDGVDTALRGRAAGERFRVTVRPAEGYGERREGWFDRVSKKYIVDTRKPKVGDVVTLRTRQAMREVTVVKVGGSVVDVDLNHPLAGKTLTFDIEILEVRAATPSEVQHGHVHGLGGVEH